VLRRALNGPDARRAQARFARRGVRHLLKLHPKLKDTFFLNTKEEDSDPYESSQFTALIANHSGIFGVYSYREVFEFDRFWGIGTGRAFALGAMYTAYDKAKSAKDLAEIGVRAGCEFDKNSSGPVRVHTIKLKD
jgi:ATP-dependent protease HslVU (ClpYQ) peptidase subunit